MEAAFPWNIALFELINASDTPLDAIVLIARGSAIFTPWLVICVLILFWLFGTANTRRSLMVAGVTLGFGLVVNFAIAYAVYVPRPFELAIGNTLLAHGQETSFPSDHATFLWSLGFGLLTTRPLRRPGVVILGLGLATAWARVYLGVHFPLDMAASFIISVFAAALARGLAGKLDGVLFHPVERLHGVLLKAFRRSREKSGGQ